MQERVVLNKRRVKRLWLEDLGEALREQKKQNAVDAQERYTRNLRRKVYRKLAYIAQGSKYSKFPFSYEEFLDTKGGSTYTESFGPYENIPINIVKAFTQIKSELAKEGIMATIRRVNGELPKLELTVSGLK